MAQAKGQRRWLRRLAVVMALVIGAALLWTLVAQLMEPGEKRTKRVVQQISLVKPPPPPPSPKVEPPKLEQKKVEIEEKVDVPKPDPQADKAPDAPPPGPNLGLDSQGVAGSDGFGLAARRGGSDLISGPTPGGAGAGIGGAPLANRFAWYGALIKERIQESVARDKALSTGDYRINVNVWVDAKGVVTRAELVGSTGDTQLDDALKLALRSLPPLREGAPGDMPQPIKLRITARG
jgi:protein TonB